MKANRKVLMAACASLMAFSLGQSAFAMSRNCDGVDYAKAAKADHAAAQHCRAGGGAPGFCSQLEADANRMRQAAIDCKQGKGGWIPSWWRQDPGLSPVPHLRRYHSGIN